MQRSVDGSWPWLRLLVCGLLLATSPVQAGARFLGTVTGSDGKPPRALLVQLEDAAASPLNIFAARAIEPRTAVFPDALGRFEVELPGPGVFKVWVRAPEHRSESIPLIVSKGDERFSASIRLVAEAPQPSPHAPQVVLSGNRERVIEMQQDAQIGVWSCEFEADAPIRYQLSLAGSSPQFFVNPTQDEVEIMKYGFWSLAHPTEGRVRLRFDPKDFRGVSGKQRAKVKFSMDRLHDELFKLVEQYRRNNDVLAAALAGEKRPAEQLNAERLAAAQPFVAVFRDRRRPRVLREAAGIFAVTTSWQLAPEFKAAFRKEVAPTSPLWAFKPLLHRGGLSTMFGSMDQMNAYATAMAREAPDRRVRAEARLYLAKKAGTEGDVDAESAQLALIREEFQDLKALVRRLKEEARVRRFPVGSVFPEYEFTTLAGQRIGGDFAGYTLLDFSAVWCGPCVDLVPQLAQVRTAHPESELRLVTLMVGTTVLELPSALKRFPPQPWHHVAFPKTISPRRGSTCRPTPRCTCWGLTGRSSRRGRSCGAGTLRPMWTG